MGIDKAGYLGNDLSSPFDGASGTLTSLTVDDVAVDGKVITMTGSTSDTAVFTVGTNGTLSIVTTDDAAAAANIQITADGTVDIDSVGALTLDSGAAINLEPAAGSVILLDGTISVDAGVVTGATSITSTAFVGDITGDVTGNASGTAGVATTVTITDNESTNEENAIIFTSGGDLDGGNIGLESDGDLKYNPSTGTLTSTAFAGALTGNVTGNASGTAATVTGAAQTNITSLGTLTSLAVTGEITATGFTGTLDGILGSGTPAAASVTSLTALEAVTFTEYTSAAAATPARHTLYEDSFVKRWCNHTHPTTINNDVGISSITNGGTGQYTFAFATQMGVNYSCIPAVKGTQTSVVATAIISSQLLLLRDSSFVLADGSLNMQIVGDD